jgi:hypothetical protein
MRFGSAIALTLGLVGSSGCDGDSDPTEPVDNAVVLESVTLAGTASEPAVVSVDQAADTDGVADSNWQATFNLEERKSPTSLPLDDGSAKTHTLVVKSAPTGGGETSRTRVQIAVGE